MFSALFIERCQNSWYWPYQRLLANFQKRQGVNWTQNLSKRNYNGKYEDIWKHCKIEDIAKFEIPLFFYDTASFSKWQKNNLNWFQKNLAKVNRKCSVVGAKFCFCSFHLLSHVKFTNIISSDHLYMLFGIWSQVLDILNMPPIITYFLLEFKWVPFVLQVNCKFHVLVEGGKSPGEIIVNYLSKNPADMIVIGTRGVGTVRRTVLGSVSTYLIHHSPVPVVVHRNTKS